MLGLCSAASLLVLAMSTSSSAAQTNGPRNVDNSARGFVEGFYSWYAPRALDHDTTAGWVDTLRLIRPDISHQLAKLLEADSAAQARCKDIAGLDFDPFLYTQEPAGGYEVGRIAPKGRGYWAEIFRVEAGKRAAKPDVVAEFIQKDRHWLFIDFHYPGGADLLTVLKSRPRCSRPRAQGSK